ncbi:MAG TPA: hypothetical protein PLV39_13620 [Fimbriimonadaceae bacterium]|nr:hypothetical protein [Fimbriimonadaceae bacterium]
MNRFLLIALLATGAVGGLVLTSSLSAQGGSTPRYARLQSASPGIREVGNINVTGTMSAGRFVGDGRLLTNVTAVIAPGTYGGVFNFSNPGNIFCGDGSCLTGVIAQGLASGTYSGLYTFDNPGNVYFGNGANLTGVVASGLAAGVYANAYNFSNAGNSFTGNGAGLTNVVASDLAAGTYGNAYDFSNVGNSFTGNGSGLTNLNASNISSGTLADARIPANICRLTTNNLIFGVNDGIILTHGGTGQGIQVGMANVISGSTAIDIVHNGTGRGVNSTTTGGTALWGTTSSISAAGAIGDNRPGNGEGVVGFSDGPNGVGSVVGRADGAGYGVRGFNTSNGIGVMGQAGISAGTGNAGWFENVNAANTSTVLRVVQHGSSTGRAGEFVGDVDITGTLSKGAGAFKIDHPLDPENKFLYHSFVESPDMKNIYDGVIECDARGEAVVQLPRYFEALNRDFRYQLTCVGGFSNVYIKDEVADNRFVIAGGRPGLKVSWQVTGIRQDAYANAHRIPNEVMKTPAERGYYLHPQAHGRPGNMRIVPDPVVPNVGNLASSR